MRTLVKKRQLLSLVAIAVLMVLLIWADGRLSPYYVKILHYWAIYIILGVTLQLVYGYTGQFSLAHGGLVAIGAYTTGLLTLSPEIKQASWILKPPVWPISVVEWPLYPALLMSGVTGGLVGLLVGAPALRVRGNYLTIVTLGLSEILRITLCNMPAVCNGAIGLRGIPMKINLWLTWSIAIVTLFVVKRLVESNYGRAFKAICEDEIAAQAVGVSLFRYKLLAFVISSAFAGVAGGLMAQLLGTIDPNAFTLTLSYATITVVVLGGVRSLTGTTIAAGVYIVASELLRAAETSPTVFNVKLPGIPGMRMLVFGLLLLVVMLYNHKGILAEKEFSWSAIGSWLRGIGVRRKRTEA